LMLCPRLLDILLWRSWNDSNTHRYLIYDLTDTSQIENCDYCACIQWMFLDFTSSWEWWQISWCVDAEFMLTRSAIHFPFAWNRTASKHIHLLNADIDRSRETMLLLHTFYGLIHKERSDILIIHSTPFLKGAPDGVINHFGGYSKY
jgi:hypothetical protein